MKTPKRTYTSNFLEYGDEYYGIHSQRKKETFSRWKRKNKIKQLKRSLQRYKRVENLPFYTPILRVCQNMIDLKLPGNNPTMEERFGYILRLEDIIIRIAREIRRVDIKGWSKISAELLENKEKKHP